jgi:hypothetical protein
MGITFISCFGALALANSQSPELPEQSLAVARVLADLHARLDRLIPTGVPLTMLLTSYQMLIAW